MNKQTKIIIPIVILGCFIIIIYNFSPLIGLEQTQQITVSKIENDDTPTSNLSSDNHSKSSSKNTSSNKRKNNKKSNSKSSSKKSSNKNNSSSSVSQNTSNTQIDDSNILLDINSATSEQLSQINGISLKLSQNIINFREKIGEFFELTELLNVPDMTYEIFKNIQDNIYINEKE